MDEVEAERTGGAWALWTALALGAGLCLRIAVLRELIGGPVWWINFVDGLDTVTHLASSRRVLADFWQSGVAGAFYQSPLYAYVLAGLQVILGPEPAALAYAQAVIGAATAWVAARLAARVAGPAAGFVAAVLVSFLAQAVFYPLYLLPATLEALCAALAIASVHAAAQAEARPLPWTFAGLALGLAFLVRPNIAVATLLAVAYVAARRRPARAQVVIPLVSLGTGLALMLAPLVLRNLAVAGLAGLLPTSGAANFRIGNSEDSPVHGFSYPNGPPLPLFSLAMLKHQAAKLAGFFWGYEMPQNVNMYLVRESSTLLALVPLGLQHLVGLAAIGLAAGRRRRDVQAGAVWVLAYAASISMFFVVGRFRLPAVPALAVLAGVGYIELIARLRARRYGVLLTYTVLGAGVMVIAGGLPAQPVRPNDYSIALDASWTTHRPGTLASIAARAVRDYPDVADFHALLAATLVDTKSKGALLEIQAARAIDPGNARAAFALLAYHVGVTRDPRLIEAAEREIRQLGIQIPTGRANETRPRGR